MVTEEVMNRFSNYQAPDHCLDIKINDICILLATVNREEGLTKNTRVRIVNITNNLIRICTLHERNPVFAYIPRFLFYLKLPFNKSFKMMRSQFPLKLAYALTINRSQGQEFDKSLIDLSEPAH